MPCLRLMTNISCLDYPNLLHSPEYITMIDQGNRHLLINLLTLIICLPCLYNHCQTQLFEVEHRDVINHISDVIIASDTEVSIRGDKLMQRNPPPPTPKTALKFNQLFVLSLQSLPYPKTTRNHTNSFKIIIVLRRSRGHWSLQINIKKI